MPKWFWVTAVVLGIGLVIVIILAILRGIGQFIGDIWRGMWQ